MFAWDDIAVFLALYREQTTSRAAAALGCSQPTVVRRIAALEHALQLQLFERSPTGLKPTCEAQTLLSQAEQIERSVCAFSTEVSALSGAGEKEIRLTFVDHFERLLIPILRAFRSRYPGVGTQLLAGDKLYDLERGEADIAIRGRSFPETDALVVHRLPPAGWTVFGSGELAPDERPSSPAEVRRFRVALIDSAARDLPIYRWLAEQASAALPPIRCSNYSALKSAIASGAAVSALPCTIGRWEQDVVPCFGAMPEFDVDVFLLARRAALRRPPVRALFDSIAEQFRLHPELLTGRDL